MTKPIRVPLNDQIPALERAVAVAVNIYDDAAQDGDDAKRCRALLLLAHLRAARKAQQ